MAAGAKRAALVAVLVAAAASFYGATYDFREVTDNRVNSLSTRALVTHGDVDLSRYRLPRLAYARPHDGDLYSVYGIGLSLVAAPIYAPAVRLAKSEAVRQGLVAVPFCAASVIAMLLLLGRLFDDRRLALGGAIAFGFGTTMWPLASMAFYSHGMVALFQILGMRGLFSRTRAGPVVAGLGFGAAAMVRPAAGVFAAALALAYLVGDRRDLGRFCLGLLPALAVIAVQNRWLWGSWVTTGYSFLGVGFHGRVLPGLWRMTFGWWRGVFVYSPFLLLAFPGVVLAARHGRGFVERRILALAAGFAGLVVLFAAFTTWWGGLAQFGYRYLLDGAAPLVVVSAYAVSRRERLRMPAAFLTAISVLTMTFGSVQQYGAFDNNLFPRAFSDAPVGQAWIGFFDAPLGPLIRLAGLAALTAVLSASARLVTDANRPRFFE